jgi:hypothetical protein
LIDASNVKPPDKKTRAYTSAEIYNIYKAMAILSKSALGKMIVNIFFQFKKPPIPMKIFSDEQNAKVCLKQYL